MLRIDPVTRDTLGAFEGSFKTEVVGPGLNDPDVPVAPMEVSDWTGGWSNFTDAQKTDARLQMRKLLDLSIRFTLDHAFWAAPTGQ